MTNYIQKAISKSIEGGWKENYICPKGYSKDECGCLDEQDCYDDCKEHKLSYWLLMSSFWQALGKALGWEESDGFDLEAIANGGVPVSVGADKDRWKKEWHRFIDHLAKNKDPNDFFKQLLSEK